MSEPLKYGARTKLSDSGLYWCVVDATGTLWFVGDGEWDSFDGGGWAATEDQAIADYKRNCLTPPPTYFAPHIEVKPLPDEADRHFTRAVEAFNKPKELYDVVVAQRGAAIAERDAARAELKQKEEGK